LILALPLLGVSIVYAIGMTVTLALLVVPGLIFICVYTVVVPAAVVDKTGVFASFSRSAELTRGNRWRILLVLILSLLIAFLIFTVLSLVFGAMMAFLDNRSEIALVAVLMQVVINAIFMSAYACLTALLYMDLRKLKDGDLPTRISGVFD
jgi:membrane-anchored glycerophosphoryl diester phosphodiesterase (GDPDase)